MSVLTEKLRRWAFVPAFILQAGVLLAGLPRAASEELRFAVSFPAERSKAPLDGRRRIKGVRKEYAELLQAAGVDTVKELKYRNPSNLAKAMADANRKRRLVRLLPSEKVVRRWIENARTLPLKITY